MCFEGLGLQSSSTPAASRPERLDLGLQSSSAPAASRPERLGLGLQSSSTPAASRPERLDLGLQSSSAPAASRPERLGLGLQSSSAPAASRPERLGFGLQSSSAPAASRPERLDLGLQSSSTPAASRPERLDLGLQSCSAPAASRPEHLGFGLQSPPQQQHPGQGAPPSSGSNSPPHSGGPRSPLATTGSKQKAPDDGCESTSQEHQSQHRRKNNGSAKKRARATGWKIFRDDMPGAAVGLQKACHLHLRILMHLLSQSAVPIRLTADEMAPFEAWFRSAEDVDVQLADILAAAIPPSNAIYEHVAAFLRSAEALSSQTAADARKVGDDNLRSMFSCVANAGLHSFTPDVFGNPESMYNLAHEHVAIHSFRNVVMRHGYSALYPVNLSLIHDDHLIQRFYRSFVYGHMKLQAGKEERRPGQLEIDIVLNNTYRRRDEFKTTRGLQIKAECFLNPHVAALAAETECHSDDEELPDRTSYLVHEKLGRDGAVSALFEIMTHRREATMAQKSRKGTWRPRTRRRELPPSDLSHALPTRVPIDYFSPDFFNALSVRDRASYMHNGIALPTEEHCRTWEAILRWKSLSMADFVTHYGTAKLALYNLPTDEELALLSDDD
ncbi:hypothetical protein B0H19DRAFT_1274975 [Mycena capillaripes]|nr:hypothetical protein B0H19DRAFT_1274975 [Mycena capillaripes]